MKIKFGLKSQLLSMIFLLDILAAAAYTTVLYSVYRTEIMRGIDAQLVTAVNAVEEIIPRGYHDRIADGEIIPPDLYNTLLDKLSEFANSSGLIYAYTYIQSGTEIHTVSTSATPDEILNNTETEYYTLYDSAPPLLYKTFMDKLTRFDEYTDSYGSFRSIYKPVTSDSGNLYVIGADIDLKMLKTQIIDALVKSILAGLLMFVISMMLGWVLVERITRPLGKLTQFTNNIASTNFSASSKELGIIEKISRKRGDEVGSLARAMAGMIRQLEKYLVEVKQATSARERVEGELSAAHDIQVGMLPRIFPPFPHCDSIDVFALLEPAKQVGGDLYDFFFIDKYRLFFVIGDVSGKGVPAALFMAMTKTLFKTRALSDSSTAEIMNGVNLALARDNIRHMFVTAFAGILDIRDGSIEYCDAGHEPPFTMNKDGKVEQMQKKGGIALGIIEKLPSNTVKSTLQKGDSLVLYTDGISEAQNSEEEMYSYSRIHSTLESLPPSTPAQKTAQKLIESVHDFSGDHPQSDDIALLVINYKGMPPDIQQ